MTRTVLFPGLGLEFHLDRVAFQLFGLPIYWYGVIIACGFLLAVVFCYKMAPRFGVKPDDVIDLLFFAVPLAIIGARLYYIVFYMDLYRTEDGGLNFLEMLDIRDGGLAIYGGVIAAVLTLLVFCRVKKINFFAFADLGAFGLLIGQCIGRWGNFVNVEAYGGPTDLPWRMGIDAYVDGVWQYMEVHPTFLYESLWNLLGFLLLLSVVLRGRRKFDGEIMWGYFLWYGFGRGLIEGLRTDSLYFFHTPIRVSQVLGFASALVAAGFLFYHLVLRRHKPEELYVNRTAAARKAAQEAKQQEEEDHGGERD
ncbi:prolipoprotein diacylglyceryl transferase [uncultured Intestinimonas sp.]|uniref:prolipoprotein diacylglyceryl transferase n=1 Tax=uncultured Intestinimonas sp. TaxID=1689265 RepID=UPI0025F0B104|nr:prolipoprotein diacylglyceryl transferase [uncultured Intestinimonas sp.]